MLKIYKSICVLLFFLPVFLHGQGSITLYNQTIDDDNDCDEIFNGVQSPDGHILINGFYDDSVGNKYGFQLLRVNSDGTIDWKEVLEGIEPSSAPSYPIIAGNDYVTCYYRYNKDIFGLAKIDTSGKVKWTKTYQCDLNYEWNEMQVCQSTTGNYFIAALAQNLSGTAYYFSLIKTDSIGNALWCKRYIANYSIKLYGLVPVDIQPTNDDGCIVTGWVLEYFPGGVLLSVLKFDSSGTIQWDKMYSDPNYAQTYPSFIRQTKDGNYIIGGSKSAESFDTGDGFLLKIDPNGNHLWNAIYPVLPVTGVALTNDSGFALISSTNLVNNLMKTDKDGNLQWNFKYGAGHEIFGSVNIGSSGNYILTGTSASWGGHKDSPFVLQTDGSGRTGCYLTSASTNTLSSSELVGGSYSDSSSVISTKMDTISIINPNINPIIICADSATNVNDFNSEIFQFAIFPNPTSTSFTIKSSSTEKQLLQVFDITGKLILAETIFGTATVDASNFAQGVYNLSVSSEHGIENKKLVIVR